MLQYDRFDQEIQISTVLILNVHFQDLHSGDVVASREGLIENHIFCNLTGPCMAANELPLKWREQISHTLLKPCYGNFIYDRK